MTTIIKQKDIGKYNICLSVSINYKGFNVYDVQVNECLGSYYTTRKCNYYNNEDKAKKAFYSICSRVEKGV